MVGREVLSIDLRKKSRAGILLYALLMLAVFSLLLQFYLQSQLSESQIVLANQEGTEAYLMAELTMDTIREERKVSKERNHSQEENAEVLERKETSTESTAEQDNSKSEESPSKEESIPPQTSDEAPLQGQLRFLKGESHYHIEQGLVLVTVVTEKGREFSYSFSLSSEK